MSRLLSLGLLLLAASLAPADAGAECQLQAGGQSKSFSDAAACENEKARLEHGCRMLKMSCPSYRCSCGGAGYGSSGAPYQGYSGGGVKGAVLRGIQQGIQQGIEQGLERARQERIRRQQEEEELLHQQQAEEERRKAAEAAIGGPKKARREEFDRGKRETLKTLRGPSSSGLGLKGVGPQPEAVLKEYHERETDRREVLSKTQLDWCKTQSPAYPARLSTDSSETYQRKVSVFRSQFGKWKLKCMAASGAAQEEASAEAAPSETPPAKSEEKRAACVDCGLVYGHAVRPCGGDMALPAYGDCVNDAIKVYHRCFANCAP